MLVYGMPVIPSVIEPYSSFLYNTQCLSVFFDCFYSFVRREQAIRGTNKFTKNRKWQLRPEYEKKMWELIQEYPPKLCMTEKVIKL